MTHEETIALLESTLKAVLDDLKADQAAREAMWSPDAKKLAAAKAAIEQAQASLRDDALGKGLRS